jgi:hypothetical protein
MHWLLHVAYLLLLVVAFVYTHQYTTATKQAESRWHYVVVLQLKCMYCIVLRAQLCCCCAVVQSEQPHALYTFYMLLGYFMHRLTVVSVNLVVVAVAVAVAHCSTSSSTATAPVAACTHYCQQLSVEKTKDTPVQITCYNPPQQQRQSPAVQASAHSVKYSKPCHNSCCLYSSTAVAAAVVLSALTHSTTSSC